MKRLEIYGWIGQGVYGKKKSPQKIYSFYKGDKWIDDGTLEEIAERQNLSVTTLRFYACKTNKKLCEKKPAKGESERKILIQIGTEDDEDDEE